MPLPRLTYDPNPPFVCYGDSTQITVTDLNATSTYVTKFAWFPNVFLSCDTCPSPWVSDTFNLVYRVIGISPFGCQDSIRIPVSVLRNSINTISKDTVICIGNCVQLESSSINPDGSNSTFTWLPGNLVSNSTIPSPRTCPEATTTYTLVISPNVCFHDTETVTIGVSQYPDIEITPGSKQVVAGTPIPLSAVITNGVLITSYAWAPASTLSCEVCYGTIATPTFTTTYVFTATSNYGCTSSDSVRFTTTCDNSQIFIPNTFTPNGDGMNDRFFISGKGISSITTFIVVNRWGEVVFENHNIAPNDPGAGWDGTYKGLVVPPDVFMYIVEGMCELGSPLKFTGDVSIVR
jgi:gliding motility-associated-like protein